MVAPDFTGSRRERSKLPQKPESRDAEGGDREIEADRSVCSSTAHMSSESDGQVGVMTRTVMLALGEPAAVGCIIPAWQQPG